MIWFPIFEVIQNFSLFTYSQPFALRSMVESPIGMYQFQNRYFLAEM